MSVWSHIIIEGYCMYEVMIKKSFVFYPLKNKETFELDKTEKKVLKNENYKSKDQRPNWCLKTNPKRIPRFRCFCDGKDRKSCPFFSFVDAEKRDYDLFDKAWYLNNNMR